jgi:hypothetical protein
MTKLGLSSGWCSSMLICVAATGESAAGEMSNLGHWVTPRWVGVCLGPGRCSNTGRGRLLVDLDCLLGRPSTVRHLLRIGKKRRITTGSALPSQQRAVALRADRDSRRFLLGPGLAGPGWRRI